MNKKKPRDIYIYIYILYNVCISILSNEILVDF